MSQLSSRLKKMGIEVGTGQFGSASTTFTHGLLGSALSVNPKTDVKAVPEVRGGFMTRRVTTNAGIDRDLTVNFPLDLGDMASGNVGQFLAAIFGVDTVGAAVGGIYPHVFTRLDDSQPPWFNIYSDKDPVPKQYMGFRPKTVKFTLKAGEGLIDTAVTGAVQSEETFSNPGTLVFSGSPIVTPQQVTVSVGLCDVFYEEITLEITRDNEAFRIVGPSRDIHDLLTKSFQIKLTCKGLVMPSEVIRNAFLAGTSDQIVLTLTDGAGKTLVFNFPEMFYTVYDGPDLKDTDILKVSIDSIVTNDNYNVTLHNNRSTAFTA